MADRKKLTVEEAVALLPAGDTIHTFRNPGVGMLVGADFPRDEIIERMKKFGVCLSGPAATRMRHGLFIEEPRGLFVETKGVEHETDFQG